MRAAPAQHALARGAPAPAPPPPAAVGQALAPMPLPALAPSGPASGLRGTVRRTQTLRVDPPTNAWKWLTLLTLGVVLLPAGVAAVVALVSVWIALAMFRWLLGIRGAPGGSLGLVDLLLLRPLTARASAPTQPVPLYIHELDTGGGGLVQLKQLGDLRAGSVMVGHDIEVRVEVVRGEYFLRSGRNHTIGAPLAMPPNLWKLAFGLLLAVAATLWATVVPSLPPGVAR